MNHHANYTDVASNTVTGADTASSVIGAATAPSSSVIGGATQSLSSSASSASKLTKSIELLNYSGMGDLTVTKPYKREPLHRFVEYVITNI